MSFKKFSFPGNRIYGTGKKPLLLRLLMSITLALPLIALIIVISVSSYRDITEDIYFDKKTRVELVSTIIHERINNVVDTAISLASRPKLEENVLNKNWQEAVKYIENIPNEFEYIDTIFLTDKNGILKTGIKGFEKVENHDFSYRDWYKGVSRNWTPYVSEFYKRANLPQINVVSVSVPIRFLPLEGIDKNSTERMDSDASINENEVLSILVIQVRKEIFSQWLEDIDLGEGSFVYITDKNGILITHPDYDTANELIDWSDKNIIKKALSGQKDVEIFRDGNINMLTAYSSCEDHKWVTVLAQPENAAFAARTKFLFITIPIYAVLFALIVTAINLLLNYIKNIRLTNEISNRLALIVENSDDAIYTRDLNDVIMTWNRGAEKIFGYKAEEVTGRPFKDFIPDDEEDNYDKLKQEVLEKGNVNECIAERTRKDGSRIYLSFSAAPLKDLSGNNKGISIIARDVTKQINDERLLLEKTKNLEELNRELETFSYSVSHDLRAPLRAITGFGNIIIEDYGEQLEPEASGYLDKIKKASEEMKKIIDNLLTLSKSTRDTVTFRRIDFTDLSRKIGRELISLKENENRKIEFSVMEGISVEGDEKLIAIAMSNLLNNALKFTVKNEKAAIIEIGIKTIKGEQVIFISDNGAGFDMKYSAKLFQPFQRLHSDSDFSGTGIGLAIVKRITDRHNGRIWVKSKEFSGTTFYIILPGIRVAG